MAKRVFRATQQLSGGNKKYRKWEQWEVGDVLIGKWIGSHMDQYDKNCPLIKVEDAQFKDDSGDELVGKTLCLNQCGMMEKALEDAVIGDILQFTYDGKAAIEKGPYKGKEAHVVKVDKVEIVDENVDL